MTRFNIKIEINCPIEQVYAAFVDWAHAPLWRRGITAVEFDGGVHGKLGSKRRFTCLKNGREITFDETVFDMVVNEACYFRTDHERMYCLANVLFRERDGGTRMTSSVHAYGRGMFWRLVVPFMKGNLRRRQQADFELFKAYLEKS
jgi:uncharacterized protein YndB with AHSA1/START domain